METHDHHSPFAIDIHLSSVASVSRPDQLPTAVIDAGPGTAIWWRDSASHSTRGSAAGTDTPHTASLPSKGLAVTLRNTGC